MSLNPYPSYWGFDNLAEVGSNLTPPRKVCYSIKLEAADDELCRDQAEAVRVAYVAATRARDLLVAPVCGDEPLEGWLDALKPVLYPADDLRRAPPEQTVALPLETTAFATSDPKVAR
jgi:hypothetical protein